MVNKYVLEFNILEILVNNSDSLTIMIDFSMYNAYQIHTAYFQDLLMKLQGHKLAILSAAIPQSGSLNDDPILHDKCTLNYLYISSIFASL